MALALLPGLEMYETGLNSSGRQIREPEPALEVINNDTNSLTCAHQELNLGFTVPTQSPLLPWDFLLQDWQSSSRQFLYFLL